MNPSKLKPALIGGVSFGLVSALPLVGALNCACCSLAVGGGVLASFLYVRDLPPAPEPRYGDAAMVGLLTGPIGAAVQALLSIPLMLFWGQAGAFSEMIENLESTEGVPPEMVDLFSRLGAEGFAAGVVAFQFVINLVAYTLFALVGGLIGAAVFHKKSVPAG